MTPQKLRKKKGPLQIHRRIKKTRVQREFIQSLRSHFGLVSQFRSAHDASLLGEVFFSHLGFPNVGIRVIDLTTLDSHGPD